MKWFLALFIAVSVSAYSQEPAWVMNPESEGFAVAITGSAMPQKMGERAQYKMAELSARKEFSANKSTYISSFQKVYDDSQGNQHYSSDSYSNSSGLLNFSSMVKLKEWKDPKSQELFILYVIRP